MFLFTLFAHKKVSVVRETVVIVLQNVWVLNVPTVKRCWQATFS